MSSYDKVVKLACKPKAAPPKAKYLDTIIAATWSEDGAVHDVCKALAPRFREPNIVVVFKALIVLHTMIRNGATDNVLSYLSSSEVLRLRNVTAGNWEGYSAPQNLQHYALYLDSRIRAYRDVKHDAIRVQAESNRDMRNSNNIEEDNAYRGRSNGRSNASTPSRSKTIVGRKLRVMTVEKGLLRETKAVHNMIDTLVECRFYLDDLEDELTTTALRMLVKDLLILFQAGNEGVINVLEHYFEMSHVDAQEALSIYRHFCKQTEKVVEYLGVAKKLQNLLNVPIPNLKHAPVSLAGALEEYLKDPNFEQNRIEYKTNKEASERPLRNGTKKSAQRESSPIPPLPTSPSSSSAPPPTSTSTSDTEIDSKPQNVVDFFTTIEEEQPTMFNPQTNSPSTAYFQQQQASNPFALRQMQMAIGQPFGLQPQGSGYLSPQQTAFQQAPNPFGLQPQHIQAQPTGHRPFSSFIPQNNSLQLPQQTGFLQPQATGSNPFRQSVLMQQTTGITSFGVGGGSGHFGMQGPPAQSQQPNTGAFQNMMGGLGQSQGMSAWGSNNQQPQQPAMLSSASAFSPSTTPFSQPSVPARPASTPLTAMPASIRSSSPPVAQPVKAHQTGTKNPFGPITQPPPPPVPKQPTLMELAMGMNNVNLGPQQSQQQQQNISPQQQQSSSSGANGFNFSTGALSPGVTDMSGVASSFTFTQPNASSDNTLSTSSFPPLSSQNTSTTTSGSTFSDSLFSSSLSNQPTGATNLSTIPSGSVTSPLKSQMTGFSGIKPFKPSSSFGASLLDSLPPVPGSPPTTPVIMGGPTSVQGGGSTTMGALNSQRPGSASGPTSGSTIGQGLRPHLTGNPTANPFRATMFSTTGGMNPEAGTSFSAFASQPTGLNSGGLGGSGTFGGGSGLPNSSTSSGLSGMSLGLGGNPPFGSFIMQQQQQQQRQQQQSASSLI
ncbi:hypothetical protein E1B28_007590 [Marasmius oreades]|uniref:ENTH domain-containing protein n=1 Tax=Marasmius oreades TaxID=181124 RepID=A0A9P7S262_9AGAR|nr:uncharacterized protein E1B28_007590 [Marasmius oreades]KAG7093957.1 hypothetical protein E1B28_007590 [Marasmius oreades]